MDVFIKACAGILVTLVIYLLLAKQGKDFSVLLTVFVCSVIAITAIHYLEPVMDLLSQLQTVGKLNPETFSILLRAVGISLLSELVMSVCSDAGNAALGKTLQLLASAVVLWMSVPLFKSLISLIEEILVSV